MLKTSGFPEVFNRVFFSFEEQMLDKIERTRMIRQIIFWLGVMSFSFFSCHTENVSSESWAEDVSMSADILNPSEIEIGTALSCVQILERKMKSSDEHFKYTVTIYGTAVKVELPDIYIKVERLSVLNLKKENSAWIKDQSIVKQPPYAAGNTYAFRAKHEVIDNVVSSGVYKIYFSTEK